jgi:isoleucyl-tRNA synthetase
VALDLPEEAGALLEAEQWAEIAIVSDLRLGAAADISATVTLAPGAKCARCWRVLQEVGKSAKHPTLCLRCEDAVESGLVCAAVPA